MIKKMTLQKPDKDNSPNQCPYCNSMNTKWEDYGDEYVNVAYCNDCDSIRFEYEDKWEDVSQEGR